MPAADSQISASLPGFGLPGRAELDRALRTAEEFSRALRNLPELRLNLRSLQEETRHPGRELRFTPLLLGLGGTPASQRRKAADAHRRNEVHGQRVPVLRLPEAKRVPRGQE